MKKIFFLFVAVTAVSFVNAQKWSVDHFTVGQDRVATVYLTNEKGQVLVKNVRAIVNPTYNQQGQLVGGSTENRGGLMLTPPIRPGSWEADGNNGNIVPVNFSYNSGCSGNTSLVYVIEGYTQPDGSIRYTGREEEVKFPTFNPADWVCKYSVNNYEIPDFLLPVQVTKKYSTSEYSAN